MKKKSNSIVGSIARVIRKWALRWTSLDKWSSIPPSDPGYYWLRWDGQSPNQQVVLFDGQSSGDVYFHGDDAPAKITAIKNARWSNRLEPMCDLKGVHKWDVRNLSDALDAWDAISNVDRLEDSYVHATDHCHDIFDGGIELLEKLKRGLDE